MLKYNMANITFEYSNGRKHAIPHST